MPEVGRDLGDDDREARVKGPSKGRSVEKEAPHGGANAMCESIPNTSRPGCEGELGQKNESEVPSLQEKWE